MSIISIFTTPPALILYTTKHMWYCPSCDKYTVSENKAPEYCGHMRIFKTYMGHLIEQKEFTHKELDSLRAKRRGNNKKS